MAAPLTVIALVAYLLPEPDYCKIWRTAKAFGASDLMLCLAVATGLLAGCLLAALADVTENLRRLGAYGRPLPVRPEVDVCCSGICS